MSAGARPDDRELRGRLALLATPGLGQHTLLRLLREQRTAASAFAVLRTLRPQIAQAARSPAVRDRVERTLQVAADEGVEIVCFDDSRYPARLAERLGEYAPPLFFARGDLGLLTAPAIAVVGCRKATPYGLDVADELGAAIGRVNGCVVSGLALGIDAAAHAAALDAGGTTIGVLGCGIDVYYPHEHMALQDRIAHEGLLVSELLPGQPPLRHHFPHRNRIIAALSSTVVVVEATERSGAVRTAEHALEQGVPVYAVPNALDLPNMQGNLALLRDGAPVYTGSRDLLEELGLLRVGAPVPEPSDALAPPEDALHCRIWEQLSTDGRHVDAIAAAAGLPTTQVLVALLELELDGRVRQFAGSRFARIVRRPRRRVA